MLNHQNYIKMIDSIIDKNFRHLDKIIEDCEKLKEARKEYYQALNELHLDIDNVKKNPEKYEKALEATKKKMALVKQDIGAYECDSYHTIEPLTIGLFGEWGSGKTHLLKGIKNCILLTQEATKERWEKTPNPDGKRVDKLVIPIFFNAWRFEKEEHIIIPLFQTLVSELENYDHIPRLKQIKTKIKILSFALVKNLQIPKGLDIVKVFAGDFSSIESVGGFFNWKGVSNDVKEAEQKDNKSYQIEQLLTSQRIESVYLKIPEWIEKITIFDDVRFVFLVDDLDRCLPENTLKMLESMKLFLDVAGCSFVLAVDDDVVERGVEHHYRDYLQRHDNHIYMTLPCEETKEQESPKEPNITHPKQEHVILPITGSEYLEKMVQLPFRIPPIDTKDLKEFLQKRYERFRPKPKIPKELPTSKEEQRESYKDEQELLNFLAVNIPAKPRKIIRTINLYESKEALMLGVGHRPILLAKLTLLELFAPKLFRFMQTKGFERIFKRLVKWREEHNRLSETEKISYDIAKIESQKDRDDFNHLLDILKILYQSRVEFNLDALFEEHIEDEQLIQHITFRAKERQQEPKIFKKLSPADEKLFLERILSDDELLWEDAFREDINLKESGVVLEAESFRKLLEGLGQNKQKLVQNPIWLKNISTHLSDDDFRELLIQHNPFKEIADEQ